MKLRFSAVWLQQQVGHGLKFPNLKSDGNRPRDSRVMAVESLHNLNGCAAMQRLSSQWEATAKRDFLRQIRKLLTDRAQESSTLTFDQLVHRVSEGVTRKTPNPLLERLRAQYKVCLIDEFQDTDSVQFQLIDRVFDADTHLLVMI